MRMAFFVSPNQLRFCRALLLQQLSLKWVEVQQEDKEMFYIWNKVRAIRMKILRDLHGTYLRAVSILCRSLSYPPLFSFFLCHGRRTNALVHEISLRTEKHWLRAMQLSYVWLAETYLGLSPGIHVPREIVRHCDIARWVFLLLHTLQYPLTCSLAAWLMMVGTDCGRIFGWLANGVATGGC